MAGIFRVANDEWSKTVANTHFLVLDSISINRTWQYRALIFVCVITSLCDQITTERPYANGANISRHCGLINSNAILRPRYYCLPLMEMWLRCIGAHKTSSNENWNRALTDSPWLLVCWYSWYWFKWWSFLWTSQYLTAWDRCEGGLLTQKLLFLLIRVIRGLLLLGDISYINCYLLNGITFLLKSRLTQNYFLY